MIPDNDYIRDFLGVTAWHKAGYTGKGVRVCTYENPNLSGYAHGHNTWNASKEIAPDCELIYAGKATAKTVTADDIDYMLSLHPDIIFASLAFSSPLDYADKFADYPFTTIFMSAGNDEGDIPYNNALESPYIYGIGAYYIMANGTIRPTYFSAEGDGVDFCGPAKIWVPTATGEAIQPVSGTSFAGPIMAAMTALALGVIKEKSGLPMSRDMLYQFFEDHAVDIGSSGKDTKCGWGAVVLPAPGTDISKYMEADMSTYYNQYRYTEVPYPAGENPDATVATSGCGVCSAGNVLTYLGFTYPPDKLAPIFIDKGARVNGGTDMSKAAAIVCELSGATVKTTNDEATLAAHLQAGGIAIGNVDGDLGAKGIFSSAGHYINVIGVFGDKLIVFDPAYYKGKFSSSYRSQYVTVGTDADGNTIQYTTQAALNIDTANRSPQYYLFTKKEEEPEMTYGDFKTFMQKYEKEKASLPDPEWSRKEGYFSKAKEKGVMDGTRPESPVKRDEFAAVLGRLGLIK